MKKEVRIEKSKSKKNGGVAYSILSLTGMLFLLRRNWTKCAVRSSSAKVPALRQGSRSAYAAKAALKHCQAKIFLPPAKLILSLQTPLFLSDVWRSTPQFTTATASCWWKVSNLSANWNINRGKCIWAKMVSGAATASDSLFLAYGTAIRAIYWRISISPCTSRRTRGRCSSMKLRPAEIYGSCAARVLVRNLPKHLKIWCVRESTTPPV